MANVRLLELTNHSGFATVLDGLLPQEHSTFHNNPHFLHGSAGGNFGMFLC